MSFAPPGTGKTIVGAWLTAERQSKTLILVHRQPLLDQWVTQLALFLGLEPKDIGQIGGGKHKPITRLDVAMIQSLVRKDNVDDQMTNYSHVIVDDNFAWSEIGRTTLRPKGAHQGWCASMPSPARSIL